METIKSIVRVLSAPQLAKVVLALAFLTVTGVIPSLLSLWIVNREVDQASYFEIDWEEERIRWMKVREGMNERLEVALEKEFNYSPTDYFADLARFEELQREQGVLTDGARWQAGSIRDPFVRAINDSMISGNFTGEDHEAARLAFEEARDPGYTERAVAEKERFEREGGWAKIVKIVGLWLLGVYFKLFPVAATLYLVWIKDGVQEEALARQEFERRTRVFLRNPLTFLLLLAAYPLVVGRLWLRALNSNSQRWLVEAEVRRTKNSLFCRLSQDESEMVAGFVRKRMSRRQVQGALRARGLQIRHRFETALVAALVVAIVSAVVPASIEASQIDLAGLTQEEGTPTEGLDPPDEEEDKGPDSVSLMIALIPKALTERQAPRVTGVLLAHSLRPKDRAEEPPEHIPICCW